MSAGVRPSMRRASVPTASTWPVRLLTATTDGSSRTMPRPDTCTNVLAVPRSIPTSADHIPSTEVHKVMSPPPAGWRGAPEGRCRAWQAADPGLLWRWQGVGGVDDTPGSGVFHRFPRSSGLLVHPYLNSTDVITTVSS